MLKLTATDLPRVMACNGSLAMPHNKPYNVDDTVRNEGIAAHWLIEQVFKRIHESEELVDRKAPNGVFITGEMVENCIPYLNDILGLGAVESDTSYSDGQFFQINGRADHIDYNELQQKLTVRDFKYGWSIVKPEGNWTLISHALGFVFKYPTTPVKTVELIIYQPRPHHSEGRIRSFTFDRAQLDLYWQQLVATLSNLKNELNTSAHCKDCPAFVSCPAARAASMNAIDVSEDAYVSDIDNGSLSVLMDQFERSIKLLEQSKKAYGELALHRLKAGQVIPNYVAEKELTNKQWKANITPEMAFMLTGKDLTKKQLITPTQALKELPESIVDAMSERREKGVKLARMEASAAVKKMFKEIIK